MTLGWVLVILAAVGGTVLLVQGARGEDPKVIRRELGLAIATGAAVGAVLIPVNSELEDRRFEREQRLEDERVDRQVQLANLAFVRQTLASDDAPLRFDRLNLAGLPLNGLSLVDASFVGADLSGADLRDSDIDDVTFEGARLDGTIFGFDETAVDRNNPNYVPPDNGGFGGGGSSWSVNNFEKAVFGDVCWAEDNPPQWPSDVTPPLSADWCRN